MNSERDGGSERRRWRGAQAPPPAAYGQTQVRRDERNRDRGEFPTCRVKNSF